MNELTQDNLLSEMAKRPLTETEIRKVAGWISNGTLTTRQLRGLSQTPRLLDRLAKTRIETLNKHKGVASSERPVVVPPPRGPSSIDGVRKFIKGKALTGDVTILYSSETNLRVVAANRERGVARTQG